MAMVVSSKDSQPRIIPNEYRGHVGVEDLSTVVVRLW